MAEQVKTLRPFRFWRWPAKSGAALLLVLGVTVYGARLPDQFACLQLITGYSGNLSFGIVDLNAGISVADPRTSRQPGGIPSPDGKFAAFVQPEKQGASESKLVVQGTDAPTGTWVVQNGMVDNSNGFGRFRTLRWSPDSIRLAFVWTGPDQRPNLTIANADGTNKHEVPFPALNAGNSANTSLYNRRNTFPGQQGGINWSANSAYLSVEQSGRSGQSEFSLWSAADLRPVGQDSQTILRGGTWAPQGSRFGGIGEDLGGQQELVIWSPEREVKTPISGARKIPDQIAWSPDGSYLVLQSHRSCSLSEGCSSRWTYDLYGSDGKLLVPDLDGTGWDSTSSSQPDVSQQIATWSKDSSTFIYLQQRQSENDLIALRVAGNRAETVAVNVNSDFIASMMYVPFANRRFGAPPSNIPPQRIVLPTMQDGKYNVELADLDGQNRLPLVQGADQIHEPGFAFFGTTNHFWALDGQTVIVVWSTMDAKTATSRVRLTWAQVDGSGKQEIDDNLNAIDYVQMATINGQKWLGYMAQRGTEIRLEVANMATGQHYTLIKGLESAQNWIMMPAAKGDLAAIQLGTTGRFAGESTLYVADLKSFQASQVSDHVNGPVQWSPDGSRLAFLYRDSSNAPAEVHVVTTAGQLTQDVRLGNTVSSQSRLVRWSQCR